MASRINSEIEYWSRCSNTLQGSAFCVDQGGNRCDLVAGDGRKTFYLRDADTNDVFAPAGFPLAAKVDDYRCRSVCSSPETNRSRYGHCD